MPSLPSPKGSGKGKAKLSSSALTVEKPTIEGNPWQGTPHPELCYVIDFKEIELDSDDEGYMAGILVPDKGPLFDIIEPPSSSALVPMLDG